MKKKGLGEERRGEERSGEITEEARDDERKMRRTKIYLIYSLSLYIYIYIYITLSLSPSLFISLYQIGRAHV